MVIALPIVFKCRHELQKSIDMAAVAQEAGMTFHAYESASIILETLVLL